MPVLPFNPGSAPLAPQMNEGAAVQNTFNPFALQGQRITLQDLLAQTKERQAQTQSLNTETQIRQRDLKNAAAIRMSLPPLLQSSGGKYDDSVWQGLMTAGVDPDAVENLKKSHVGNDEAVARTQELTAAAAKANQEVADHARLVGAAVADRIAKANYDPAVAEAAITDLEQNDPAWAKSGSGNRMRALMTQNPAAFKAKIDSMASLPAYQEQQAGLESTKAQTAHAKASTAALEQTTEINKQNLEAMKQFAAHPELVLGEGGMVDRNIDPKQYPDLNKRTKARVLGIFQGIGTPDEKQKAANQAIQQANSEIDTLERETDPRMIAASGKKAAATIAATNAVLQASGGGNGTPEQDPVAAAIANYQSPPPFPRVGSPQGMLAYQALMKRVMAINPDYHAQYYDTFRKTEQDATTGKIGTSANALNTMMGHLEVLNQAADALKNGDVQILNRIANGIGAQTGSTAKTTYDTIVHRLGPEVTKAYLAAGGSVGERGTNEEDFSSSLSPQQIHSNIAISAKLADSKIRALDYQYKQGTYGRGQQKLISDEAETARQRLAGGKASAAPAGKIAVISPEGTPGFIDANKWEEAQKRGFKKQ